MELKKRGQGFIATKKLKLKKIFIIHETTD
jgi:hypothetical protein